MCQDKLVQLLSMFEVSFTARQRKNYLFYCLLYLFRMQPTGILVLLSQIRIWAWRINFSKTCIWWWITLTKSIRRNLAASITPFSRTIHLLEHLKITRLIFLLIYGDGTAKSKGIPLFVFNYLDYKLWEKYANELRGERTKRRRYGERTEFFANCLVVVILGLKYSISFIFRERAGV
jgi:hypothetical protein